MASQIHQTAQPLNSSTLFSQIPSSLFINILNFLGPLENVFLLTNTCKHVRQLVLNNQPFWFPHFQIWAAKIGRVETIFDEKGHYFEYIKDCSIILKKRKELENVKTFFKQTFSINSVDIPGCHIRKVFGVSDLRAIIVYKSVKIKETHIALIDLSTVDKGIKPLSHYSDRDDMDFTELSSSNQLIVKFPEKLMIFDANNLKTSLALSIKKLGAVKVNQNELYFSEETTLSKYSLNTSMLELAKSRVTVSEKDSPHQSDIKEIYVDSAKGLVFSMDSTHVVMWMTSLEYPQKLALYNYRHTLSNYPFVSNSIDWFFIEPESTSLLRHHTIDKDRNQMIAFKNTVKFHDNPIKAFCTHQSFLMTASLEKLIIWDLQTFEVHASIHLDPFLKENPVSIAFNHNHFFIATEHKIVELVTEGPFWTGKSEKKSPKKFLGFF